MSFKTATFGWCAGAVKHDFGFTAGVDGDTNGPRSVFELTTAENDVGRAERDAFAVDVHVGMEAIDVPIRFLATDKAGGGEGGGGGGGGVGFEDFLLGVTSFEIGFAVEVDGLDVGDAGRVAGGEEEHVTRDGIVGMKLDELADADVFPASGEELGVGGEDGASAVVFKLVGAVTAEVFVGVFDGGDGEDKGEREDGSFTAEDAELGDLIHGGEDEEVDVGETVELLEEVAREEGEERVFGGGDGVGWKTSWGVGTSWIVDVDEASFRVRDVALGGGDGVGAARREARRRRRRMARRGGGRVFGDGGVLGFGRD